MKTIGFVGVGIMGKPMVRNLMKAGFDVVVYARNREKVTDVVSEGASFCETLAEISSSVEALITMVGFPSDVEDVYFGAGKILESAKEGTYLIDMTTTSPSHLMPLAPLPVTLATSEPPDMMNCPLYSFERSFFLSICTASSPQAVTTTLPCLSSRY